MYIYLYLVVSRAIENIQPNDMKQSQIDKEI